MIDRHEGRENHEDSLAPRSATHSHEHTALVTRVFVRARRWRGLSRMTGYSARQRPNGSLRSAARVADTPIRFAVQIEHGNRNFTSGAGRVRSHALRSNVQRAYEN